MIPWIPCGARYLDQQSRVRADGGSGFAGEARKMKITTIAARLRKVAVDMEVIAAINGDLDFPDEPVRPFIINPVTDDKMLKERPAAAASQTSAISGKTSGAGRTSRKVHRTD